MCQFSSYTWRVYGVRGADVWLNINSGCVCEAVAQGNDSLNGWLSKAGHHPQCCGCPPVLRPWLEHRAEVGGCGHSCLLLFLTCMNRSTLSSELGLGSTPSVSLVFEPWPASLLSWDSWIVGILTSVKGTVWASSSWEISFFAVNRFITSKSFLLHYLFIMMMILFCDKNTT